MARPSWIAGLVLVATACVPAGDGASATPAPSRVAGFDVVTPVARWQLPADLQEVSGLAVTRPGFVVAHNDERGHLVEIDHRTGRVSRQWTFGSPVAREDFEGIDISNNEVTMMTSDGRLWSGTLPVDGGPVTAISVVDTGLGRRCELEGLARSGDQEWILPCKTPRGRQNRDVMFSLFFVRANGDVRTITVPPVRGTRRLSPSSITPASASGDDGFLVVFGPEHTIGHVTAQGQVTALVAWPAGRHPQPEGVAVDGNRLVVADEGQGRRPGTLTVYGRAQ